MAQPTVVLSAIKRKRADCNRQAWYHAQFATTTPADTLAMGRECACSRPSVPLSIAVHADTMIQCLNSTYCRKRPPLPLEIQLGSNALRFSEEEGWFLDGGDGSKSMAENIKLKSEIGALRKEVRASHIALRLCMPSGALRTQTSVECGQEVHEMGLVLHKNRHRSCSRRRAMLQPAAQQRRAHIQCTLTRVTALQLITINHDIHRLRAWRTSWWEQRRRQTWPSTRISSYWR
jgi:hypothetical protein